MRPFVVCGLFLSLLLAGCAAGQSGAAAAPSFPQGMPISPSPGSSLLTANMHAGDALQEMLLLRMGAGGGILTTTFVSLDNFDETSAFGRVTSQQVGSRLGQYGFRVLESRLAADITLERRAGEFMLTRDACALLAGTYSADAVLVGCYSEGGSGIFVSSRVVRLADNVILAAYEYLVPRDGDAAALLGGGSGGGLGGTDSVWNRYARRTPAFVPLPVTRQLVTRTAAKGSGTDTARVSSPTELGRPINPAAPPTPFPGKKKKS